MRFCSGQKRHGSARPCFRPFPRLDCIFADLGIDPAHGCQLFEAETLIEMDYRLDPRSGLILLRAGGYRSPAAYNGNLR